MAMLNLNGAIIDFSASSRGMNKWGQLGKSCFCQMSPYGTKCICGYIPLNAVKKNCLTESFVALITSERKWPSCERVNEPMGSKPTSSALLLSSTSASHFCVLSSLFSPRISYSS